MNPEIYLCLSGTHEEVRSFGSLDYWIRLKVPMMETVHLYREKLKAAEFIHSDLSPHPQVLPVAQCCCFLHNLITDLLVTFLVVNKPGDRLDFIRCFKSFTSVSPLFVTSSTAIRQQLEPTLHHHPALLRPPVQNLPAAQSLRLLQVLQLSRLPHLHRQWPLQPRVQWPQALLSSNGLGSGPVPEVHGASVLRVWLQRGAERHVPGEGPGTTAATDSRPGGLW